jgi:hypothetical protein
MARFRVLIDEWDDCSFSFVVGGCDHVCRPEDLGTRFTGFGMGVDVMAVVAVSFFCIRPFLGRCAAMRF